ncbi:MAG: RNA polymerase sigma factor [Acidobacteria bacterium]|nr:RNA polymerase sigma factor [Acidobacteriota bacterium]
MHSNVSDDELLNLIRAGDESAFVALYRRKQSLIYRFALRMSGSESIAEDVTQEVFLHLMRGSGHFDATRGSFQAYLFGIARNQVLRRLERDRTFRLISLDGNGKDHQAETDAPLSETLTAAGDLLGDLTRRETIESVRQAVLALPPHYREVVVLCDLHEMSYQEAAEVLNCALGTVRSRLHRARAILVERLQSLQTNQSSPSTTETIKVFSERFIRSL